MEEKLSPFQRRFALIVSGAILLGAGIQKRLLPFNGLLLAAMAGLLIRDGIYRFRPTKEWQ